MISERESHDLELIKNEDQSIVKELCSLAIRSIEEELSSKFITTVSKKLHVDPIQIERGLEAIISIYFKATEKSYNEEDFIINLNEISWLTTDSKKKIVEIYLNNKLYLKTCLKKLSVKGLEYENMDWRLDILSRTRAVNDLSEPIVSVQLQLKNTEINSKETLNLQMEPSTLIHVTQSLELALHEARSYHIRKFKKVKNPPD